MRRKKEIELDRREKWLRHQAEMQQRIQNADPYDEELNSREREFEEKLLILKRREQEIKRIEQTLIPVKQERPESILCIAQTNHEDKEFMQDTTKPIVNMNTDSNIRRKETKDIGIETDVPEKSQFFPKFSTFSGDEPKQKNESSFSEWKYEVLCTIKEGGYSNQVIAQAITKSLRGQAKQVLVSAGSTISTDEIIKRLERVFGNVSLGESIFREFYTASQKQGESLITWA